MTVFIKNMVCSRCKIIIESELNKLGFAPLSIELGKVVFKESLLANQLDLIGKTLLKYGFELIPDKQTQIIEQIKTAAITYVYQKEAETQTFNFSTFLEKQVLKDYNYLSSLFSEITGATIEKYLISLKIERVKELLVYDELTLSEIAFQLNYSSVAHLSSQFKKITGLTPSYFKTLKDKKQKSLTNL